MKQIIFIFYCALSAIAAQAQTLDTTTIEYFANGTIRWANLKQPSTISQANSIGFLKTTLCNGNNDVDFVLTSSKTDSLGQNHSRYYQTYKGLKVHNGSYLVHSKNNLVQIINGSYVPINLASVTPALTESQALAAALNHINASLYSWQDSIAEAELKRIKNDSTATNYPQGELIIAPSDSTGNSYILAYQFTICTATPIDRKSVFINAATGNVISNVSMMCSSEVQGTAQTKHSGTQTIVCDQVSTNNFLLKGHSSVSNTLITTQHYYTGALFSNTSNQWTASGWANYAADADALDDHWNVSKTLDYFLLRHGRLSFDGLNSPIINKVHGNFGGGGFWGYSGYYGEVSCGDGNEKGGPFSNIDEMAHEIAHGLSTYHFSPDGPHLGYSGENGGLNETLSDIWGAIVEDWAVKNFPTCKGKKQTWLFAEERFYLNLALGNPGYARSFKYPKTGYWYQPDCYGSATWNPNADVHVTSGVGNKWFYILCEGEAGKNDLGNCYSVKGITIEKAAQIVYKAEMDYTSSAALYYDFRLATIQAAKELYGTNSQEAISVANAWYAVGVGNFATPVSINSPVVQLCNNNQTVELVVSNSMPGLTVNWSTPAGVTTTTTNTLNEPVTAAGTYNYSVSVSWSSGGCSVTKNGTITVGSCYTACTNQVDADLTNPLPENIAANKVYAVHSNLIIGGSANKTFTNCELIFDPNTSITVQQGATLNLIGCHLYSCGGMWQGIKVNAGGVININHSSTMGSLIEDAAVAVDYDYSNDWLAMQTSYSSKPSTVFASITNTTFNRNNVGVRITSNYNDPVTMPASVFNLSNNVFTSRNLPFSKLNWLHASEIKVLNPAVAIAANYTYPQIPQTYDAPYIPDGYSDANFGAYLKQTTFNAATLTKPVAGIVLNNVQLTYGSSIVHVQIGTAAGSNTAYNNNLFDNLGIGIKATNTNLSVVNSVFQKAYMDANNLQGFGIYATGLPQYTNIKVSTASSQPRNAFWDMKCAIKTEDCRNVQVTNAQIISSQSYNQASAPKGNYGIWIKGVNYNNVTVTGNYVMNIANGVYVDAMQTNNTPVYVTNSMAINNNTFIDFNLGYPCSNCFVANAITILGSKALGAYKEVAVTCNNNQITRAFNGIVVSALTDKNFVANSNTINLKRQPTTALTPIAQFGISYVGGRGINASTISGGLPRSQIINNTITGDYAGNVNTHDQTGIFLHKQWTAEMGCNDVNNLVHGFRFTDKNVGIRFWDNWMHIGNQNGYTLDGKGEIGVIGFGPPTNVWCRGNNHWDGTSASWNTANRNRVLVTNGSDADKSKLYVRNINELNPDGACFSQGSSNGYAINTSIITLVPDPNKVGFCVRCTGSTNGFAPEEQDPEQYEEIANENPEDAPTEDEADALMANQQIIYDMLLSDPGELLNNNAALQQFITLNNYGSLNYAYQTQTALAHGNYALVDALLTTWQPSGTPDENSYNYYSWLYNKISDPNYVYPIEDLFALANSCPYTNGIIVFAARNLYNSLTDQTLAFDNACDGVDYSSRKKPRAKAKKQEVVTGVSVYPNPTNGYVYINLPNQTSERVCWQIDVANSLGATLQQKKINTKDSKIFIELKGAKGIYFIKVLNCNTGALSVQKVILE